MQTTVEFDGSKALTFRDLSGLIVASGGHVTVQCPGKRKQRLVSISGLSGMQCCDCGRNFFRRGLAGDAAVVHLPKLSVRALEPVCVTCFSKRHPKEESDSPQASKVEVTITDELQSGTGDNSVTTTVDVNQRPEVVVSGIIGTGLVCRTVSTEFPKSSQKLSTSSRRSHGRVSLKRTKVGIVNVRSQRGGRARKTGRCR